MTRQTQRCWESTLQPLDVLRRRCSVLSSSTPSWPCLVTRPSQRGQSMWPFLDSHSDFQRSRKRHLCIDMSVYVSVTSIVHSLFSHPDMIYRLLKLYLFQFCKITKCQTCRGIHRRGRFMLPRSSHPLGWRWEPRHDLGGDQGGDAAPELSPPRTAGVLRYLEGKRGRILDKEEVDTLQWGCRTCGGTGTELIGLPFIEAGQTLPSGGFLWQLF